jgi:hypothetical protein
MYKIAKNLSPFTLGLLFCCSQATLLPSAHAASLNPTSSVDVTLPSANTVDPFVLGATAASGPTTLSSVDCPLQSGPSSTVPKKNSENTSLNYQSNEIASSDIPVTKAAPKTTQDAAMAKAKSPTLIAQAAAGDCCGIGGAATCEVGGVPTGGAALGGLSPLLGLLGLLPAAAVPIALSDGGNNSDPGPVAGPLDPVGEPGAGPGEPAGPGQPGVPGPGEPGVPGPGEPPPPAAVPEPSSTGAIVAVFGMMGLWLSRRHRSGRKDQNVSLE